MFQKTASHWKLYALALALLFAAIFLAFLAVRTRYERRLREQIWPTAVLKVPVFSHTPPGVSPTVMLLGDSRMAQWGLPQLARWRVVNAGVGGATTGQIRLLTPGLLAEVRPDAVVLEAGINDLKFLGLRPEMAPAIVSLAASNLVAVVNECAARHCKVLVLETWPAATPGLVRRLVWNATIPAAVNQLNERLQAQDSPERGIQVVDLFNQAGLKPEPHLYQDTLHFTPETYTRLTPALEKELDGVLPAAR